MTNNLFSYLFPSKKRLFLLLVCYSFFTFSLSGQTPKSWCDVADTPDYWKNLQKNSNCDQDLSITTTIGTQKKCGGKPIEIEVTAPKGDSVLVCWGDGSFTQVKHGTQTKFTHLYMPPDPCPTDCYAYTIRTAVIQHCGPGKMSFVKQEQDAFICFPPIAKFHLEKDGLCPDEKTKIFNDSKECSGIAAYSWTATGAKPWQTLVNTKNPVPICYSTPGTYMVSMTMHTATNPEGCQDSSWKETIIVSPPAVAAFTIKTEACVGESVPVTNNSQYGGGWEWTKVSGPGSMTVTPNPTLQTPLLSFSQSGTYKVRLKVVGCGNPVAEQEITIRDKASSTPNLPGPQCEGYTLTLNSSNWPINLNGCPPGSVAQAWVITAPDGTQATYNPTFPAYPSPIICNQNGTYKISLTLTNCCGTSAPKTVDFVVKKAAQANFNYSLGSPCIGPGSKTIQFNATSTGTPTVSNTWSISPPGSINPAGLATISQPGTYTVTLTADNGCPPPSVKSETFTLFKTPSATVANIQPVNDCADVTVSFGPQAAPGITQVTYDNGGFASTDLTYTWNCPDCVPSQQTGQFPTGFLCKQLAQEHEYTFTLTIHSTLCGDFTVEKKITVRVPAVMEIVVPNIFCQSELPHTLQSNLPNTLWKLDGQPLSGGIVPASTMVGSHTIEAYRNDGCTTPDMETLVVNKTPVAKADANDKNTLEACVETGKIVLNPSGDFPGIWTSNQPWVTFSGDTAMFSQNGTAVLTYTVTDPVTFCKNADNLTLIVKPNENPGVPNAILLCNTPGLVPLPLMPNPNLKYSGLGVDANGNFDPTTAGLSSSNPVNWEFTNAAGCTAKGTMTVNLQDLLAPGVLNAGEDKVICQNGGKIIRDGLPSGIPGLTWLDSLGNQISPNGHLEIDLAGIGKEVLLKVILAHDYPSVNCAQFDTVVFHVLFAKPDAGGDIGVCFNDPVFQLPAITPPPGWNAHWTPGTMVDPADGDQTFILHFTRDGCDFTDELKVKVNGPPGSNFSIAAPFCSNQVVNFQNLTTHGNTFWWYDNNVLFSNDADPQGVFLLPGHHSIKLLAATGAGCRDSFLLEIDVKAPPVLTCSPSTKEDCGDPLSVEFAFSSANENQLFFEIWLNGQLLSTVPAMAPPQKIDLPAGLSDLKYTVKLIAKNECETVVCENEITVKARAKADFGITEDTLCSGLEQQLLCKSLNSVADTFIVRGVKYVTSPSQDFKFVAKNDTEQPIVDTVLLISKNGCNTDTAWHFFVINPNEYEAVAETHDTIPGQKHCAGETIRLTGHATAGAKVFWTNGAQRIDQPSIEVEVGPGWNEWVLHAEGCGEDTDTARFFGLAAPLLQAVFLPDVCPGDTCQITILTDPDASAQVVFASADTLSGSPVHRVFQQPGPVPFTVFTFSKEGCPTRLDTALTVRPQPSIPATLIENCTQEKGFDLEIDDAGDPSVWVTYPSGSVKEGYSYPKLQPGVYQVRFKERLYGCSSDTIVRVDSVREVTVQVIPQMDTLTLGESIPLFADGQYVETYNWIPADEVDDPTSFEPAARPENTGWTSFIVIAEDTRKCQARDTARIFVTHEKVKATLPSAFTPNADGYNDVLYPRTNQAKAIKWMDFRVFDLNGGLMFVAPEGCLPEDPACGWDGQFRGKEAQMGNYRAIVEFHYLNGTRSTHHKIIRLIR